MLRDKSILLFTVNLKRCFLAFFFFNYSDVAWLVNYAAYKVMVLKSILGF